MYSVECVLIFLSLCRGWYVQFSLGSYHFLTTVA